MFGTRLFEQERLLSPFDDGANPTSRIRPGF
jgi:hypothetical protein